MIRSNLLLPVVTFAGLAVLTPVPAAGQEALGFDAVEVTTPDQTQPAVQWRADAEPGAISEALQPSAEGVSLLAPLVQPESPMASDTNPSPVAVAEGSPTGLGFMIAGGAALVGGLLIGGTAGNVIAAGGVALGVYGIIIYF